MGRGTPPQCGRYWLNERARGGGAPSSKRHTMAATAMAAEAGRLGLHAGDPRLVQVSQPRVRLARYPLVAQAGETTPIRRGRTNSPDARVRKPGESIEPPRRDICPARVQP